MIGAIIMFLIYVGIIVVFCMALWKAGVKAGVPGWAFIIPIYNLYLFWQISGRPILWFILCFVPCINIVAMILISIDVAKAYGKDALIGVLMAITGIGWLIVGFGDAVYSGRKLDTGLGGTPPAA